MRTLVAVINVNASIHLIWSVWFLEPITVNRCHDQIGNLHLKIDSHELFNKLSNERVCTEQL